MSKNILFIILGHLCVAIGILGLLLPLVPGTPFLILAAYFYSKASPKFHHWLLSHKYLGPPVNNWNEHGAISRKTKFFVSALILTNLTLVSLFVNVHIYIKITVTMICLSVVLFIVSRPNTP